MEPVAPQATSEPARAVIRVDVSDVAPPGCKELALEIIPPAGAGPPVPRAVLVCFPGGGMSRGYFDLAVPGYSFAEFARQRGFLVVLADHPGVGDSDRPDDGWTLTPDVVAGIEVAAVRRALAQLRAGDVDGVTALASSAAVVGVAHSMGAQLLIHQQALSRCYDGLILLGWGGHGLPQYLDAEDLALAELDGDSPDTYAAALVARARRRHADPLPVLGRGSSGLLVASVLPDDVHQALVDVRAPLLAVVGHASLIPGSTRRASAEVSVPVFLGVGENDIATNHRLIPSEFPASTDITLFVLAGAGHNQNVEPGRHELWERVTSWADQLASRRN
ncbi:MAG TPA: alpha/beta hydrolase [Trebonia sp.]|nr:alpha/beta hydrolase [Trebonia sp.]